jgi:hypothetical protein
MGIDICRCKKGQIEHEKLNQEISAWLLSKPEGAITNN